MILILLFKLQQIKICKTPTGDQHAAAGPLVHPPPRPRALFAHRHRRGVRAARDAGDLPQHPQRCQRGPRFPGPDGLLHEQPERACPAHHAVPDRHGRTAAEAHGRLWRGHAGARADIARGPGHGQGHRGVVRPHRERLPGRRDPPPPDALRRHDCRGPARPASRCQGNRARCEPARHQRRGDQLAHPGRIPVRPQVLGHLCRCRSPRRAHLPAPQFAATRHVRAFHGSRAGWRDLRLWCGDRPSRAAHHHGGRVRPLPQAAPDPGSHGAKPCRSGPTGWTTCTGPR